MTEDQILSEAVQRIRARMNPRRIILFGSRARQTSHAGSDFDLLVVKESEEPRYRRAAPLYTAIANLPAEFDIVVYTPREIAAWAGAPMSFVSSVIREGRVLYEDQA